MKNVEASGSTSDHAPEALGKVYRLLLEIAARKNQQEHKATTAKDGSKQVRMRIQDEPDINTETPSSGANSADTSY